jgi:hypothetical protein
MLASMLGDPMQRLVTDPKHSQHPGKSLSSYCLSPLFFFYLNNEFFRTRLGAIQVFVISSILQEPLMQYLSEGHGILHFESLEVKDFVVTPNHSKAMLEHMGVERDKCAIVEMDNSSGHDHVQVMSLAVAALAANSEKTATSIEKIAANSEKTAAEVAAIKESLQGINNATAVSISVQWQIAGEQARSYVLDTLQGL